MLKQWKQNNKTKNIQPTYLQSVTALPFKQQTTVQCVHSAQITFVVKKIRLYIQSSHDSIAKHKGDIEKKMHCLRMPKMGRNETCSRDESVEKFQSDHTRNTLTKSFYIASVIINVQDNVNVLISAAGHL